MLGNPGSDGVHWPMILNVPGEGFGDDFLQIYTNQSLLSDADDGLFLLDEALEAAGGSCPMMEDFGGPDGPPTGLEEPIPSNLEVDPNAWFSNVYTYSPVWQPPSSDLQPGTDEQQENSAITEAGSAVVASCYDSKSSSVQLTVTFEDIAGSDSELPWLALGYREDEECLMTPRGGGESPIILISADSISGGVPAAYYGSLSPALKSFDSEAVTSLYSSLTPLADVDGFTDVEVTLPSSTEVSLSSTSTESSSTGSVRLHFKQQMEAPEVMHLMYAIGSSSQLGYHSSRLCFEVEAFPPCSTEAETDNGTTSSDTSAALSPADQPLAILSVVSAVTAFLSSCFL